MSEETQADLLRALADGDELIDTDGDRVRLREGKLEYLAGGQCWTKNYFTLRRPPKRKPAPATLRECAEAAPASARYRRPAWPESHWAACSSCVSVLDATANDWLVSTDGGRTWWSPNGEVEG